MTEQNSPSLFTISGRINDRTVAGGNSFVQLLEKSAEIRIGDGEPIEVKYRAVIEGPDGANVLAYFFRDGAPHVVLVEQYRNTVESPTWEAPGGRTDGEDIRVAMARELRQETGIEVDHQRITVVFKEYIMVSLVNAFGHGGLVEINEAELPEKLLHGEVSEGERTVVIVRPLEYLLKLKKDGRMFFDMWTARLLYELKESLPHS